MTTHLRWDLDSIFPGGSESIELANFINTLKTDLADSKTHPALPTLSAETQQVWIDAIEKLYKLSERLFHVGSFAGCLVAQNVKDDKARMLDGELDQLHAQLETLWTRLSASAATADDAAWDALLQNDALAPVAFNLNEQRTLAKLKLPADTEALISELAADGYHAWDQLYNVISGSKQVEFEEDGETKTMSLGQLQSKFMDAPDRETRQRAFTIFEKEWGELAPVISMALNYQAGFRLTTYQHRGWDSVLQEPLFNNRLQAQTLDTMWRVIDEKSERLLDYFSAKAKVLGIDKLTWFDVFAPVGKVESNFSFEHAANFVIDNLRKVNPDIADFCRMAVDNGWVESENRSGKRAGAFCTRLPLKKESRVFMTFNGSYNGMSTLAHELGHGYHGYVLKDAPFGAQRYTMSVAETASTFNELVVTDAYLSQSTDDEERLGLLARKLDDAVSFMMNIRARYDFEREFFARRAEGQLSVDDLNALMVSAQKKAFHNGLADDGYHSLFWASKLHFYITRAPFYNFPYTFGFLFSNGIYAMAQQTGDDFKDRYIALLRDTGSMDTETLAQTHLGVDLTQPEFWENAVENVLSDIDEFVSLANKLA